MAGMLEEIDSLMRHIWLKVVKKEYEHGRILEESNLHSTVYFHLRKLIESSKTKRPKQFIYSEMPFVTKMRSEGKKSPRVDLAIVILDEKEEAPTDLLAVIELKHYDFHANSIGISKDLDHLKKGSGSGLRYCNFSLESSIKKLAHYKCGMQIADCAMRNSKY